MNESSEALRTRWKSLKDSYNKRQEQSEPAASKTSNCVRYHEWRWAQHVQLLDSYGYQQPSHSKVSSTSFRDCLLDAELPPSMQLVSTTSIPTPLVEPEIVYLESSEALANDQYDTVLEHRSPVVTGTTPTVESTRQPDPLYKRRTYYTDKRNYSKSPDNGDIGYLKHSKREEQSEAVDFLFKSYAETFKTFTAKKQVLLKVRLAKLFADAELDEMKEPSVVMSSAGVQDEHDYGLSFDLETPKHSLDSDISSIG